MDIKNARAWNKFLDFNSKSSLIGAFSLFLPRIIKGSVGGFTVQYFIKQK